ncbi:MAG: substrate-binding domain-containing protein [Succinivibrio sp.]|nr:substrate-binding domain-containing protein [Succinivibrio sp.]
MIKTFHVFSAAVVAAGTAAALTFGLGSFSEAYADNTYTIAGVGKHGSPWFVRHFKGVAKGAEENGMSAVYAVPQNPTPEEQLKVVQDYVDQGVNALLVVPNNAESLEGVFEQARAKGIAVVTQESQGQKNADYDVELLDNTKFGELMIDDLVKNAAQKKGSYAIFVGSLTVPAHNMWADAAVARQKQAYPDLKFIDKFPVSEDRNASRQTALSLIDQYPDLLGIICTGSEGAPGVSMALREKSLDTSKFVLIGVTTPNVARKTLKDGYMTEAVLWDPAEAARVQAYVAKLVLDGKSDEIKEGFEVPGFGKPEIRGRDLIFNIPLVITKENVDKYHF